MKEISYENGKYIEVVFMLLSGVFEFSFFYYFEYSMIFIY